MKSIAIIGRGRLGMAAILAAQSAGWTVQRVVTNRHEPEWDVTYTRRLLSRDVPYIHPPVRLDRSGDWRSLVGVDVDVVLSVLYDRIIGPELIDSGPRILNLHLGKLPEYRGMRPINWALKNGESVAGVTLHEVDKGIDTGPIVAQTVFSIWPEVDEVRDVWRRAVRAAEALLDETMPVLDRLPAVPQDETRACYYSAADIPLLGDRSDWTRP